MSRTRLVWLVIALLSSASVTTAQPVFDILNPSPPGSQDPNWEIPGSGFSVSNSDGEVRVYANFPADKWRWSSDFSALHNFRFVLPDSAVCSLDNDPLTWTDPRCSTDAIGLIWKPVACVGGETTCGWGGTWNAYPGEDNIAVQPFSWLWPNQSHEDFGTDGYATQVHHLTVNAFIPTPFRTSCANGESICPPATGSESSCFPNNPNTWATGTANSKVVEVNYSDGSSRWFMAFNAMYHVDPTLAYKESPSADIWRIMWAYSDDGKTWTVDPQILFRDAGEAAAKLPTALCEPTSAHCCIGAGAMITDLIVDDGYFYLTMFTFGAEVYLLRSPVDPWSQSTPGYGTNWQVVSGTDAFGDWIWSNVSLGQQVSFLSVALDVFPDPQYLGGIRQSAIARVFETSAPNSDSKYVALVAEDVTKLWLYTTDSLVDGPFQRQSQVTLDIGHPIGDFGLEIGFTHYPDNAPATPRIIDDQLEVWFTTHKSAVGTEVTIDRFTGAIYNLF